MKIYFAGPLFSAAERAWNDELARALRDAGHDVFLPQDQEPGLDAPGIFANDVGGIDAADALEAIVDGEDPDSGTAWEVGYAYGKKPIVLVRTDFRTQAGSRVAEILEALRRVEGLHTRSWSSSGSPVRVVPGPLTPTPPGQRVGDIELSAPGPV